MNSSIQVIQLWIKEIKIELEEQNLALSKRYNFDFKIGKPLTEKITRITRESLTNTTRQDTSQNLGKESNLGFKPRQFNHRGIN